MVEFGTFTLLWIKAIHVISVIAWMAGLLYLPRLFVYHADAKVGSEQSETFKVMERRLLRVIMNPAMIVALITGVLMVLNIPPEFHREPWLMLKVLFVIGLLIAHMMMARWRRQFANDENRRPAKFYRMINEVPTLLMIGIVIAVIVKPFS